MIRMKLDNENIKRLEYIHKEELLAFLSLVIQGDFEESPEKTKDMIKKKLFDLKINIGYLVEQYLQEKIIKED